MARLDGAVLTECVKCHTTTLFTRIDKNDNCSYCADCWYEYSVITRIPFKISHHISCGLFVIHKNEILMIKTEKQTYDFPKGKLEKGECYKNCAIREMKEETGLLNKLDKRKVKHCMTDTINFFGFNTLVNKQIVWYIYELNETPLFGPCEVYTLDRKFVSKDDLDDIPMDDYIKKRYNKILKRINLIV